MKAIWTILVCAFYTSSVTADNPVNVKFAIVYDLGDNGIEQIVAKALKHAEYKITNAVELKAIEITRNINTIASEFQKFLVKHTDLNFVLDFTRSFNTSYGIRLGLLASGYPAISTNTHDYLPESKTMPQVVLADPPERIAKLVLKDGLNEMTPTIFHDSFGIVATSVSMLPYPVNMGYGVRRYTNATWNLPSGPLKAILEKHHAMNFYMFGSHTESIKLMQDVSDYKADWIKPDIVYQEQCNLPTLKQESGTLFTNRFSWWSISMQLNETFTRPHFLGSIKLVNPQITTKNSKEIEKFLKTYNTKNVSDLFYADLIHIAVRSFSNLNAKGNWQNRNMSQDISHFKFNWTGFIESDFSKHDNLLGKYTSSKMFRGIFSPDLKFWIEGSTPNKTFRNIGESRFNNLIITNHDAWRELRGEHYIGVTIVVDPPFMYNSAKLKNQSSNETMRYFGFVFDLMQKLTYELPLRLYLVGEAPYGKYDNKTNQWTGAVATLLNKEADMVLGAMEVTEERLIVVNMTEPFFIDRNNSNAAYAYAFRKGFNQNVIEQINYMIAKLQNQRYLEMLTERWFNENSYNYTLSKDH